MRYQFTHLLTIIFILSAQWLWAQNQTNYIEGYVLDISNDSILTDAKVTTNTNISAITDMYGYFKLPWTAGMQSLEVSILGYHTKIIDLQTQLVTHPLKILLIPKTEQLKEVAVEGERVLYNRKLTEYTVLDYAFVGDSIFVLQEQMGNKNKSLIVLNQHFDSLAVLNSLPKNSRHLFKDCLGHLHVISKDSAYQIVVQQHHILFHKSSDIYRFNKKIKHCLFRKDGRLFFERSIARGFGKEIFVLNDSFKNKQVFISSIDFKRAEDFAQHARAYRIHNRNTIVATNDTAILQSIDFSTNRSRFLKLIACKPIQNAICLFKDTIVYCNYLNSKLELFADVTKEPKEIAIDYDVKSNWTDNILQDQVDKELYILKQQRMEHHIYHLQVQTGKLTYVTSLSVFEGRDLKVNNGYLYYLTNVSKNAYHIKRLARKSFVN